ncbi:MAG: hypothetical protein U5Q03_01980 [Bacteroidota bacterium]|nr:hypothetical protein [Bacteroidota bacterium]
MVHLLTLNFNYASSGGLADVMFDPGCEIKTNNLVNVPVTYVDGVVSDLEVSGNLDLCYLVLVIPNYHSLFEISDGDNSVIATTAADGIWRF